MFEIRDLEPRTELVQSRVEPEVKQYAERRSKQLGITLADYLRLTLKRLRLSLMVESNNRS